MNASTCQLSVEPCETSIDMQVINKSLLAATTCNDSNKYYNNNSNGHNKLFMANSRTWPQQKHKPNVATERGNTYKQHTHVNTYVGATRIYTYM